MCPSRRGRVLTDPRGDLGSSSSMTMNSRITNAVFGTIKRRLPSLRGRSKGEVNKLLMSHAIL